MILHIFIFVLSCALLFWSGSFLVIAIMRMARFLGWREFVVAFFLMSLAASVPELLIGVTSALHKIPELSFGNIVGANIIHFSLAIALCALILKGVAVESRTVQAGSAFTVIAAILPLLLILDGDLSRLDGLSLIMTYMFYISWLFARRERFTRIYDEIQEKEPVKKFKVFLKDLGFLFGGTILLLISAEGIIRSASFFAQALNVPLALVGILIVGAGTALPETYFCLQAARKGQSWMILGSLMGCTAITASLVLGIVALIQPIKVIDCSPFAIARFFLIVSAVFFFFFVRTGRVITKKEALFLLAIYIAFVLVEILAE
jgi:cation:H+ antiporter